MSAIKAATKPIKKLALKREVLVRSGVRAGIGETYSRSESAISASVRPGSANSDATMGNQGSGLITPAFTRESCQ